jgi:hypothetical protein
MNVETGLALVTLLAFEAKHFLCDFVLQSKRQASNKGFYGHLDGLTHAGTHCVFTIPVLLILTHSAAIIAPVVISEFLVHYHVDWIKARTERLRNWTASDNIFWTAYGADQFVHQVTYIAIVAVVLSLPQPVTLA